MATTEERMKILQMIQEGKISAEEGAQLLSALSRSAKGKRSRSAPPHRSMSARWLRVRVTDMKTGRAKVNVNLPLKLIDAGLSIAGNFIEDIDIDIDDIMETLNEAMEENLTGKIIDVVDAEDGEHVEIFIE